MDRRHPPATPGSGSSNAPFRRRRIIWFILLLVVVIFVFGVPWELPAVLQDLDPLPSGLSRANIVQHVKSDPKKTQKYSAAAVDEIYGVLHLVTSESDPALSHAVDLDASKPIEMSVYAGGESVDWVTTVEGLQKNYPVVVFSKTYCPFSKKAKALLETYDLSPKPKIIEVDLRDDGDFIKLILGRITGRATFPNILVNGKSIGGSDEIHNLHSEGKLRDVFEAAGVLEV